MRLHQYVLFVLGMAAAEDNLMLTEVVVWRHLSQELSSKEHNLAALVKQVYILYHRLLASAQSPPPRHVEKKQKTMGMTPYPHGHWPQHPEGT